MTSDVLKTMSGEGVLRIIRDTLANEAARIRACQERYVADKLQVRIDPGRLAVILCLNAAVDVVTATISLGQDAKSHRDAAKAKGSSVPASAAIRLEVVQSFVGQARSALISEWGGASEDEADAATGQEGTDDVAAE